MAAPLGSLEAPGGGMERCKTIGWQLANLRCDTTGLGGRRLNRSVLDPQSKQSSEFPRGVCFPDPGPCKHHKLASWLRSLQWTVHRAGTTGNRRPFPSGFSARNPILGWLLLVHKAAEKKQAVEEE